ncbi:hypothetical protein ACELLULO517_10645 [Acidisoma cellulosilytica]|uniref:Uncharacterized protein n=1 Tax=Acidisoma cellulosilyticum TaxID=2802395 RepID=A0A963Z0Y5_9PROT|nr:hypothetical protein [Acidisoma cellulosilyticum]MCB8880690.1 hypothetical protein [Acidisoma cellulosilyticum]
MNSRTRNDVVVEALTAGDIRPLYPLVLAVEPGLLWSQWDRYARRMVRARPPVREGIIVARRRGHPMPCGAVCYRRDRDLRHGLVLTAEHFVAIDLLYPQAVLTALARALDELADRFDCAAIRSVVLDRDRAVAENLGVVGHNRDGLMLTKYRF